MRILWRILRDSLANVLHPASTPCLPYPYRHCVHHPVFTLRTRWRSHCQTESKGTMVACFCWKVLNGYIPGIFLDWHIGWTLYQLGWPGAIGIENYGWIIEFTPAFFGAGMLSGINASWSFFGGSILSWDIIAPSIVATGQAVGKPYVDEEPYWINYLSMSFNPLDDGTRPTPSPRYWLLWPGVLVMLVFSFVEIGMSSRSVLWSGIKSTQSIGPAFKRIFVHDPDYVPEEDIDPAPLEDRVKTW
jgi:hypothetical protein